MKPVPNAVAEDPETQTAKSGEAQSAPGAPSMLNISSNVVAGPDLDGFSIDSPAVGIIIGDNWGTRVSLFFFFPAFSLVFPPGDEDREADFWVSVEPPLNR